MSNAVAIDDGGRSTPESATPPQGNASNDAKAGTPTKRLHTRANLGWVAGFLDAEGCIRIDKREGATAAVTTYALEVSIAHASRSALEHFRSLAKIESTLVVNRLLEGRQWIYLLSYRDAQAVELLTLAEPYLVATYRQAQVGVSFFEQHQRWTEETRGGADADAVTLWHARCEVVQIQLQSLKRVA